MTIDTRAKRAAILGVARPWMRNKLPNTAMDLLWRASTGNTTLPTGVTDIDPPEGWGSTIIKLPLIKPLGLLPPIIRPVVGPVIG